SAAGGADFGGLPLATALERGSREDRADPRAFDRRRAAITADSVATIIYTSGTTGRPKGVMLTHDNLMSNVEACLKLIPFGPTDGVLSFLPLSHVFQRMVEYASLAVSASIAYTESLESVLRDMGEARPTIVAAVPRFFEKVYEQVEQEVSASPRWRQGVFRW